MSDDEKPKSGGEIFLKNVRIAFPELFVAKQYEGQGSFTYGCTLLIQKGSENDKIVRAAIDRAANQFEKKKDSIMADITGQSLKFCYIDGDRKAYDGFAGNMALGCKRQQKDGKPDVMDRNFKVKLNETDGRIYGGCLVNAKVQLWAQVKGKGAPGMRCGLIAIQFSKDGEAFGGAPPANDEGFENVEADSVEEFA